jgi:hypothetical protein
VEPRFGGILTLCLIRGYAIREVCLTTYFENAEVSCL